MNNLAVILCISASSLIYLSAIEGKRIYYFFGMFLFAFCLLTGSKKAIIYIISFLGLYYVLKIDNFYTFVKYFFILIISILIILYMIFKVEFLYNIIGLRIESLISQVFGFGEVISKGDYLSDLLRIKLINDAVYFFKLHPLHGIGLANFEVIGTLGLYAHNNYAEISANLGLIGLSLYYIPIFIILIKSIIRKLIFQEGFKQFSCILIISILLTEYAGVYYNSLLITLMYSLIYVSLNDSNSIVLKRN